MANKKLLITGATGFIGQHFINRLSQEPELTLKLLVRKSSDLSAFNNLGLEIAYADLNNPESLTGICRGIDTVVHLAAQVDCPEIKNEIYERINYQGGLALAKEAVSAGVNKFILISSIAAMGIRDIGKVNEEFPCSPTHQYGKSKLRLENDLLELGKKHNLDIIILRPPTVYGEGEKYNFLRLTRQIINGPFFFIGNGLNHMDFCSVDNLVEAIRLSITRGTGHNCYLITDATPYTIKEVAQTITELTGAQMPQLKIPRSAAYLAAYLLAWGGKLFNFSPPLYPSRVQTLTASFFFDLSKAKKELNYQPSGDFRAEVKKTIDSYRNRGLL